MRNLYKDDVDECVSNLTGEFRLRFEEEEENGLGSDFSGSNDEIEFENVSFSVEFVHSEEFDDYKRDEVLEYSKRENDSDFAEDSEEEKGSIEIGSGEDGSFDDSEGDDDARSLFPCPFCYVDIEVHALCNHFHEEHCFDVRNALCPLCAGNLGRDVTGHFVVHHRNSLKHMRWSHMPGSNGLTMLGNELSLFLGYSENNRPNSVSDNLSPDLSCPKSIQQDICSHDNASVASNAKSLDPHQNELQEDGIKERMQRATFVQELFASTIL